MSEHTPQHPNPHPDSTVDPVGIDPAHMDVVPGDPPVPITVWRTATIPADAGRAISTRLATRLVAAYSRPGQTVVDLTTGHALGAACAAGGREHHPAWFTPASSLIIGPATDTGLSDDTGSGHEAARHRDDDSLEVNAWFGDDLTDPDLPGPDDPVADLPPGGALQGATSLVVASWPLEDTDTANRARLAWLLTGCTRLLRSGGCLILVVAAPPGTPPTPEDLSPVVDAAAEVGLGYLQHIVALTATTDGDCFVYHATDEELLTLDHDSGQQLAVTHQRAHVDVFVFGRPQPGPSRSAPSGHGRTGGDRRA
ncbi:MAG: hypothetical protein WCA46_20375 [Actinocatenispora sp.]